MNLFRDLINKHKTKINSLYLIVTEMKAVSKSSPRRAGGSRRSEGSQTRGVGAVALPPTHRRPDPGPPNR